MKTYIRLFIFYLIFSIPVPVQAQTKRALVIGIGKQEDSAWNKINGDKDVPYVLEILNNANYKQIITCVNEKATKAGIVSAFQVLEQSCQPKDVVYIHFSGHGQQVKDMNNDETDALDESWIPYDAYMHACDKDWGEKHLIDDEINLLLTNIRNKIGDKGKILVVIDACHSGSATRGSHDPNSVEIARGAIDTFKITKPLLRPNPKKDIHSNQERWVTLSACESDQENFEMRNPAAGKLTYAIYSKVRNCEFGSNDVFFRRLKIFININSSRSQTPTMTGETTKYNITDLLR